MSVHISLNLETVREEFKIGLNLSLDFLRKSETFVVAVIYLLIPETDMKALSK